MDKLYSAEDIEIGKYYIRGYDRVYKLMERTGIIVENYSEFLSHGIYRIYKFQIFTIETGTWDSIDMVLSDAHTCFIDLDKKRIKEIIERKKIHLESLEMLLK